MLQESWLPVYSKQDPSVTAEKLSTDGKYRIKLVYMLSVQELDDKINTTHKSVWKL